MPARQPPRRKLCTRQPRACATPVADTSGKPEDASDAPAADALGAQAAEEILSSAGYVVAPASALRSARSKHRSARRRRHPDATPSATPSSPTDVTPLGNTPGALLECLLGDAVGALSRAGASQAGALERAAAVEAVTAIMGGDLTCAPGPIDAPAEDGRLLRFAESPTALAAAASLLGAERARLVDARLRDGPGIAGSAPATEGIALYFPLRGGRGDETPHIVLVSRGTEMPVLLGPIPGDAVAVGAGAGWEASAADGGGRVRALVLSFVPAGD